MTTRRIQVYLPEPLWDYVQARKPLTQSPSAFCAALIERGLQITDEDRAVLRTELDKGGTLGIRDPGERIPSPLSFSNKKEIKENKNRKGGAGGKTDPFARKALDPALVPEDLAHVSELLIEFWSVKKGTRSKNAYKRLCTKLRGLTPEDQRKALAAASDAGWWTIYEPKPPPSAKKPWEPPEQAHPASKVFTASDFELPPSNPLLKNLF